MLGYLRIHDSIFILLLFFYYFGGQLFAVQLCSILSTVFLHLRTGHSILLAHMTAPLQSAFPAVASCHHHDSAFPVVTWCHHHDSAFTAVAWCHHHDSLGWMYLLHSGFVQDLEVSFLSTDQTLGEGSSVHVKLHLRAHSVLELASSSRFYWYWPKGASKV